jgi:hypothetical protein
MALIMYASGRSTSDLGADAGIGGVEAGMASSSKPSSKNPALAVRARQEIGDGGLSDGALEEEPMSEKSRDSGKKCQRQNLRKKINGRRVGNLRRCVHISTAIGDLAALASDPRRDGR